MAVEARLHLLIGSVRSMRPVARLLMETLLRVARSGRRSRDPKTLPVQERGATSQGPLLSGDERRSAWSR